jgi:hypothetical protein
LRGDGDLGAVIVFYDVSGSVVPTITAFSAQKNAIDISRVHQVF